ncbi:MAG: glycosyltransferase family 39 protein [Verrucomicrobiales bacterium]|nr:glycosyltransferase family 39 protein [Verrucomicrobiales bacterium]
MSWHDFKSYSLALIILLVVTVPHLEQGDYSRDTGRYAAVGLYMFDGGDPLAPHLNPETPYFNKPPLALVIHGIFLKIFGAHVAVARIPSVLAALSVVLLSMLSLRQIGSRSEAVVSGVVLALSYEFSRRTREISLDFWQLFFVMFAVYFVLRSAKEDSPWRLLLAGVFIGLGLLCKPLVALGTIPVFAAWLVTSRRATLLPWLFLGTLPVAVLVAAPWHIYMYCKFGHAFLAQYFGNQILDRALGLQLNQPFIYYFKLIAQTYWPWLIVLACAFYRRGWKYVPGREMRRDTFLFAAIWVAVILLGISCFPDKKPNYALPLYPMMSWLVAWGLCRIKWVKLRKWYRRDFPWFKISFAALGIALSVAPVQLQPPADPNWKSILHWFSDRHVPPDQVVYYKLSANDVCYYYLQTGNWPRDIQELPDAKKNASVSNLFVIARSAQISEDLDQATLLKAGKLAILPGNAKFDVLSSAP